MGISNKILSKKYLTEQNDLFNMDDLYYHTLLNAGYKREQLPQIDKKNIDDIILHFQKDNLVKKLNVPLYKLKPAQKELNYNKILKKINTFDKQWLDRCYICSKEKVIIDGHHDFANGLEQDPNHIVLVYKINLPLKELVSRLKRLKVTTKKNIVDKLLESL